SCSDVSTWTILISKLATVTTINNGAPIHSAVSSVCLPRFTTESISITPSREALHQRPNQEIPPIHQYEQQYLETRGNHHRRPLQHANRSRKRSSHDVNHQEGQEQNGADLKSNLQLREDVRRHHDAHRQVFGTAGSIRFCDLHEKCKVFLPRISQHEVT